MDMGSAGRVASSILLRTCGCTRKTRSRQGERQDGQATQTIRSTPPPTRICLQQHSKTSWHYGLHHRRTRYTASFTSNPWARGILLSVLISAVILGTITAFAAGITERLAATLSAKIQAEEHTRDEQKQA